jgi:hypothetical protein
VSKQLIQNIKKIAPVKRIYLGRNTWSQINSAINRLRKIPFFYALKWVWPITSTIEISMKIAKGRLLKSFGFIIIYDRSVRDVIIKYKNKDRFESWFPLLVGRIFKKKEADLCYLFIADPKEAAKRKNTHSVSEITKRREIYLNYMGHPFKIIDTTKKSIHTVSAQITRHIFQLCSIPQCRRAKIHS